mmetsp:Transcript_61073/g.157493  ORF Transcript_61073/g.157493 Transcript_61073/m.157493 type:complete len:306 (-) Transcript_61073:1764-2681(-)
MQCLIGVRLDAVVRPRGSADELLLARLPDAGAVEARERQHLQHSQLQGLDLKQLDVPVLRMLVRPIGQGLVPLAERPPRSPDEDSVGGVLRQVLQCAERIALGDQVLLLHNGLRQGFADALAGHHLQPRPLVARDLVEDLQCRLPGLHIVGAVDDGLPGPQDIAPHEHGVLRNICKARHRGQGVGPALGVQVGLLTGTQDEGMLVLLVELHLELVGAERQLPKRRKRPPAEVPLHAHHAGNDGRTCRQSQGAAGQPVHVRPVGRRHREILQGGDSKRPRGLQHGPREVQILQENGARLQLVGIPH